MQVSTGPYEKINACKKLYTFDLSFKRNLGDAITRPKIFKMKSVTFDVNTQLPTVAETYLIAPEFLTAVCRDDTPCRWIKCPTFRRTVPPSSTGSSSPRIHSSWPAWPWRQRHYDPFTCRGTIYQTIQVTSQKTRIFAFNSFRGEVWSGRYDVYEVANINSPFSTWMQELNSCLKKASTQMTCTTLPLSSPNITTLRSSYRWRQFFFFILFLELVISYVYMTYDVTRGNRNKANATVRLDTTVSAEFNKKDCCGKGSSGGWDNGNRRGRPADPWI